MERKLRYEGVRQRSREDIETVFADGDEGAICDAMFSAAHHEPDWRWVQTKLIGFLSHPSLPVRSAAIGALAEFALFRGKIDLDLVLTEIYRLRDDSDLAQQVKQYLEDIKMRLPIQ